MTLREIEDMLTSYYWDERDPKKSEAFLIAAHIVGAIDTGVNPKYGKPDMSIVRRLHYFNVELTIGEDNVEAKLRGLDNE